MYSKIKTIVKRYALNPKTKAVFKEYAESLLIALVLAMIIRTFVIQAFKIPTGSMNPTLIAGDRILVNKFIYRFRKPERGEIVVFKYPQNPKLPYIKRLVGVGPENIEIRDGRILINEEETNNQHITPRFYYNRGDYAQAGQTIDIPEDNFFVLGDNSGNSKDSRYWGFVPRKNFLGKALLIYWPLNRLRLLK